MISNLPKPIIDWAIDKKIYTRFNAVPHDMCDSIINYGVSNVTERIDKYPHVFKTSFNSCLLPLNHSVHEFLTETWEEIIKYFKFSIDFIEPYELKQYQDNDFFGSHVDNYYGLKEDIDRKITMVIQLSDENTYEGGNLKIINKFAPKNKGSIIAFPSYFPHEVLKTVGCRWSLIGWAWGPYWQ